MPQPTELKQQVEHGSPSQWRFYIGQWVEVRTQRPNVEQYDGMAGQVKAITNKDIIYCVIGRYTPCFHPHELRAVPAPGGEVA